MSAKKNKSEFEKIKNNNKKSLKEFMKNMHDISKLFA